MLTKTKGIALNYIRYKETSIIVRIYTEQFGIQSYLVNGVRSAKSKSNRIALYQPLTLLDLVVYHNHKPDSLHRISEVRCYHPFNSIPFDVVKSSVALFVTEILSRTLKEETSAPDLFSFIEDTVLHLDSAVTTPPLFPAHFLIQLSFHLGFGIESAQSLENQLREHHYPVAFGTEEQNTLNELISGSQETLSPAPKKIRNELLEQLILFYKIHIEGFGDLRSLVILREVLS